MSNIVNFEHLSIERIAEALRLTGGIYTAAAAKLGCAPNTVKNYVLRHPELQAVLEEVREGTLDLAEGQLLKAMGDGDLKAVIFYLKCKGKHRGYVERQEMAVAVGAQLAVKLEPDDLRKMTDEQLEALANDGGTPPHQGSGSP